MTLGTALLEQDRISSRIHHLEQTILSYVLSGTTRDDIGRPVAILLKDLNAAHTNLKELVINIQATYQLAQVDWDGNTQPLARLKEQIQRDMEFSQFLVSVNTTINTGDHQRSTVYIEMGIIIQRMIDEEQSYLIDILATYLKAIWETELVDK